MTNEIALYCMKAYSEYYSEVCEECPIYGETGTDHCFEDALEMAIKALKQNESAEEWYKLFVEKLEQEPSGDAISRQAVLELVNKGYMGLYARQTDIEIMKDKINDLPPINPQEPKTGHWIMPIQDDGMSDPIYYQVRCSKCGFDLDPQTWHQELHQYNADKYCPNCGARMISD